MAKSMTITGTAPRKVVDAATSTGDGETFDLQGAYSKFGLQVNTAGSTSAVTADVKLLGAIDTSSGATFVPLSTWSSTGQSEGDVVFVADKPVTRIRGRVDGLSSTSSTAPSVTAWASAAP